jgi:hypothetical protein
MQLKNGFNITQSDMRPLLEQYDKQRSGVRTWRQLFGNAALGYNAQSDALKTDYADAISQAYMSNYAQRNAIASAGLSAGSTQQLLAQNRNDLHTAYEQYVRNYGSDAAKVASAYGEEVNAIEGALTERAQNFANLYNSAYRYLSEELYGSTRTTDEGILDYLKEHNLDWAYLKDEQGNPTDQLMSWSQMSQRLFNPDGTLTVEGQEFYDQMFNSAFDPGYVRYDDKDNEYATRDFRQWLSDRDNDLFNWWIGQDNYNYNLAGTNQGTANVLQGRESTDDEFHQSDYLTDKKVSDFNTKYGGVSDIVTNIKTSDAYNALVNADKLVEEAYAPGSQYSESGALAQRKAARGKLWSTIETETMDLFDTMDQHMASYDAELKKMLGDKYSTFVESNEYKNARNQLDVSKGDLAGFALKDFREYGATSTDEYINLYEKYVSEYRKAYETYLKTLQNFAKKYGGTKKSSGF